MSSVLAPATEKGSPIATAVLCSFPPGISPAASCWPGAFHPLVQAGVGVFGGCEGNGEVEREKCLRTNDQRRPNFQCPIRRLGIACAGGAGRVGPARGMRVIDPAVRERDWNNQVMKVLAHGHGVEGVKGIFARRRTRKNFNNRVQRVSKT